MKHIMNISLSLLLFLLALSNITLASTTRHRVCSGRYVISFTAGTNDGRRATQVRNLDFPRNLYHSKGHAKTAVSSGFLRSWNANNIRDLAKRAAADGIEACLNAALHSRTRPAACRNTQQCQVRNLVNETTCNVRMRSMPVSGCGRSYFYSRSYRNSRMESNMSRYIQRLACSIGKGQLIRRGARRNLCTRDISISGMIIKIKADCSGSRQDRLLPATRVPRNLRSFHCR